MNQHKSYRKFFAMALSIVMVAGLTPVPVTAEDIFHGAGAEIILFEGLEGAERTVPPGTSLADLNLPEELTATVRFLGDNAGDVSEPGNSTEAVSGSAVQAGQNEELPQAGLSAEEEGGESSFAEVTVPVPVTWSASPEYNGEKEGIYTFTAKVPGFTVSTELPSIVVTVGEVKGSITAFDGLADNIRWQNTAEPVLPPSLTGIIEGNTVQIPVTWEADHDYNMKDPVKGLYVFTAQPRGYTLLSGVKAPRITVYIPATSTHATLFRMAFSGTGDAPIEITTADQLAEIAALVNDGRLRTFLFNNESERVTLALQKDIDLSAYGNNWNDGKGWIPIGYNSGKPFAEIFDGGGHKITGLYIKTTDGGRYDSTGLFGYVDSGVVRNLGIEGANIAGGDYTGCVAGEVDAGSTVQNCYATGNINGTNYTGGVAGEASGTVQNCYTEVTVSSMGNGAGGVIGRITGQSAGMVPLVENCYAAGGVSSADYAGGIVGYADGGTVRDCAGLNPYITAASDGTIGRVTGFQGSTAFYGNAAFSGMMVAADGIVQSTISDAAGKDGEDKTPAKIREENFWTAASGFTKNWDVSVWTMVTGNLPGLFGTTVKMPDYIVDSSGLDFRGEGTEANPYQISTAAQLIKFAELVNMRILPYADPGRCYKLTADIDLSGYNADNTAFNGGRGWVPIGTGYNVSFRGCFDGNGKVITGLYIRTAAGSPYDSTGLFGYVSGGMVQNLGVTGADVTGGTCVGSIVGYIDSNSTVQNCYATGSVSGSRCVGGVTGAVDGNGAKVKNCYVTVSVSGTGDEIGGISGYVFNYAIIENCYVTGTVTGDSKAGGIVGAVDPNGIVKNCAALNFSVSGDRSVGRITGFAEAGVLTGNMVFGGMIVTVDGTAKSVTDDGDGMDGVPVDAGALKTAAGFPEALKTTPWSYTEGRLPILMDSTGSTTLSGQDVTLPYYINGQYFAGGDGTSSSPYGIATAVQLAKLAELVNTGSLPYAETGIYYRLTADIDLSGYQSGEGWVPIGGDFGHAFKGNFDGGGRVITGVYSKRSEIYNGLFGYVNGGMVQNLGVVGASIKGASNVGGVAGSIDGDSTVQNCYVTGVVSGTGSNIGGIAGRVDDNTELQNCYVTGAVSGMGSNVGGLAGIVDGNGAVRNCYTTGAVSGTGNNVGGVAGIAKGSAMVQNCVALNPSVGGSSDAGRVVGHNSTGTLSNNYAFSGMTGGGSSKILTGFDGGDLTIGRANTAEFWTDTSNWDISGWDAVSIWMVTDNGLPVLRKVDSTQSAGGLYLTERDISNATVIINGSYTYTGSEITPDISVTFGGETLAMGVDYTISCSSNTNAGNAVVTLTGMGNFKGTKNVNFTIGKKAPVTGNLKFDLTTVTYNGSEQGVLAAKKDGLTGFGAITVKYDGSMAAPVTAGTYTVTVDIGEGANYAAVTGLLLGNYTIEKKQVIVKADDKTVKAGEPLPAATLSYSGFIGTDSKDNALSGEAVAEYTGVTSEAGTFPITVVAQAVLNDTVGANYILIHQDGTLTVTEKTIFTVTAAAGANGSISPSGTVQVVEGGSQTFTITPDSGCRIFYVMVDGVNKGAVSSYTFNNVSGNHVISVTFDNSTGGGDSSDRFTAASKLNQPTIAGASAAVKVSGGRSVLMITDGIVKGAIKEAQSTAGAKGNTENGIGVEVSGAASGVAGFTLTIERAALDRLVKNSVMRFDISGLPVILSFDRAALEEIQRQSDSNITILASPVKAAGVRSAFDIKITSTRKGKPVGITSFGRGSVTFGIAATLGKGEHSGCLYGVTVGKKISRIADSAYETNTGYVIFAASHTAVYGVGYGDRSAKFTDIEKHWARESIDYMAGRGLFDGTSDTTFSPDAAMSREMLVMALGRLAGADVSIYKASSFTDVKAGGSFQPYIEWAYKKGIIQGTGNGQFAPDRAVTREEIAGILQNYAKVTGYNLPVTRRAAAFTDGSSIGSAYSDAVRALQQAGIMMGEDNNRFNPGSSATRGEVSAMLYRYIKLTIDPSTAQGWAENDSGRWYYFYADGSLARNTKIDGYEVDENGLRKSK